MKILHVCPLYYPSIGGNQLHIQTISEKLVTMGHEVHVFTANSLVHQQHPLENKFLLEKEVIGGAHVHRFKNNLALQSFIPDKMFKIPGGFRLFKFFWGNSEEYWRRGPILPDMLWAIGRLKPDIMMASNNVFFTTYLCVLAKKYFSIPFALMPVLHVCDNQNGSAHRLDSLQEADSLIANTNFEKNLLIKMDMSDNKIDVVPLGVPIFSENSKGSLIRQKYGIPKGPLVAYLGRKDTEKGIEELIDAMRIIWQTVPACRLLIAGQRLEHSLPTIQKHIRQYPPQEQAKIINIDNFSEDEKSEIYSEIDVLAMPSISDCFGLVYLEAWAYAKPVIACHNTPQEDIITDGHDGILVDYGNSTQLAQAILKIIKNSDFKDYLGQNGLQSLKTKFNVDLYAKNLLLSYQSTINRSLRKKPDHFLKSSFRKVFYKVIRMISADWELQIRNQNQFNRYKSKESQLSWQALPPGSQKRLDAGGVQIGEKLFVFGGLLYGGNVLEVVNILDLRRQKWIESIKMPADMPQTHLGMIGDGKRYIYSISGQLGGNCRPPSPVCYVFDTRDKVWMKFPELPEARYACTIQVWNGRLHAMGGSSQDRNTPACDHWSIAIKEGKSLEPFWRSEPPIPRGGPHRASAIFNDSLFVFGGQEGDYIAIPNDLEFRCTGDLTSETVFPDVYQLKQGGTQWQKMTPMPIPVSHTEFAVIHYGSRILLIGGQVQKNPKTKKIQISDAIQAYDPLEDRWEIIGSLPYRTKATIAAYHEGLLYFTTGQRDKGPFDPGTAKEFDRSLWRARIGCPNGAYRR